MKLSNSVAVAATSVFALASIAPAFAHESRILPANNGQIRLVVGFHAEPAWEDSFNAIDVILSTYDGACPAPNSRSFLGQPIDTGGTATNPDPDTVNLRVTALYLKKAVPPTGPNGSIAPKGIEARLTITDKYPLGELFGGPGTYNSWFRPTRPGDGINGAYGFRIVGTVHAGPNSASCPGGPVQPLAARTARINTFFVCREGSLNPTASFHCIEAIQPFPGRIEDGYVPNAPFDTD
ncbi:MAG: hypothetical protein ACREC9_00330 [Methylocella sp.]